MIREAQTMRMHHHPNVLSLHTSFLEGQHLWFVMPYIKAGSVLNIMKFRYKDVSFEALLSALVLWVMSRGPCVGLSVIRNLEIGSMT